MTWLYVANTIIYSSIANPARTIPYCRHNEIYLSIVAGLYGN